MKRVRFSSAWEAIEPTAGEAANMKLRADLMLHLRDRIREWELTQAKAAKRLDITQPRLNDLLRGRIDKFSLDSLVDLCGKAKLTVQLKIRVAA
jgi:predicted XRE-type DNA-binding protein